MSADFSLSRDSEFFIQQQVAVGAFRDRTAALEAGVGLLRQRQALLDRLDKSAQQLESGDYLEFSRDELHRFFQGLKDRAHRRADSKSL